MLAALFGTAPTLLDAQDARERRIGAVPREVAREFASIYNAPSTLRRVGDFTVAATDTVRGTVAVRNGAARVLGLITGDLIVLNGDVSITGGGRVDGSVGIVGGSLEAPERAALGGNVRVWGARIAYRVEADTVVVEAERVLLPRWSSWQVDDTNGADRQMLFASAHTYNRVEGLPIYLGPRVRVRNGDTRVETELFGIYRTIDPFGFEAENFGYRLRAEVKQGRSSGVLVGSRLFDEVDAVERWQLEDNEVGLNAGLFTRDYRDYWRRHGAQGYAAVFGPGKSELRVGVGRERWSSSRVSNVPSVFNSGVLWRVNPAMDEAVMSLVTVGARLDTRNVEKDPKSGWRITADYERGRGTISETGAATDIAIRSLPGDVTYGRVLVDARRYNRLGPVSHVNLRAVLGALVHGDQLPMQRRFAMSGIDALPGWDFRQIDGGSDLLTCATGSNDNYARLGRPAQCERMVLLQAEYRGDFRVNLGGDPSNDGDRRWWARPFRADGAFVVFTNSGRGWLVGTRVTELRYPMGSVPTLSTWRTDVGGGIDFGALGVYVAQAVSHSGESPNVYVRLGRRF
jgi:hypothetical protein